MIVTQDLSKNYQDVTALDGLTLRVGPGEIFGLLGPNGAGKTTTIKILTTLARPTRGQARIMGFDVVRQPLPVKRLIAVCPQEINLDKELTAYENLLIYGQLYQIPELKARIAEMLALGQLTDRARNFVKEFSGGMQRRLLILRALMSRPQVLFLDEPTVGLDPQVRRQLWDMIGQLKAQGITMMLTTHYIEEAEILCDRVGILNRGRLIALDTPRALIDRIGGYVLESLHEGRRRYQLLKDKEEAYALAREEPQGVVIRRVNLEDVFIQLTGERLKVEAGGPGGA
jgi:ABC-2 type transport system ATP-binding protein